MLGRAPDPSTGGFPQLVPHRARRAGRRAPLRGHPHNEVSSAALVGAGDAQPQQIHTSCIRGLQCSVGLPQPRDWEAAGLGGAEVGFPPARGWRRRFWFTNILQMGQWAVLKPLLMAVSPRDQVLGGPQAGGRRQRGCQEPLSICCGKDREKVGFGHFFWLERSSEVSRPLSHPLSAQRWPEARAKGRNPPPSPPTPQQAANILFKISLGSGGP